MTRKRIFEAIVDPLIAFALAAGYVALLLATVKNLGYARDEGFYFHAASDYKKWFDILFSDPSQAVQQDTVDRFWRTNHEHPAFVKSLFALSVKLFHQKMHVFTESGTAFRFPGMVLSSLGVATVYLWGRRAIGRLAGLVAALLLALQPAIFYHSHLACFDVAVLTMWLVTTYAYKRSIDGGGLPWAILTGLLYGLELNTKHNAWLLPPALVIHLLVTRGPRRLLRDFRVGRAPVPAALVSMAVLGPIVFYGTWPWIWFDTGRRLAEYVSFHMNHEYYNMEFLGVTYFRPPMPRLYAWVMTVATVPTITMVLTVLGILLSCRELPWWRSSRARPPEERRELERRFSTRSLWFLCMLTSYAPWLSNMTPIFGGTKHWITAYPFMCLFAGLGFDRALRGIRSITPPRLRELRVADVLVFLSVVLGPAVMTFHAHPWGLSAYMPIIGGTPGGASLGLNRSFWGYTTGAVQDFIDERAPKNAQVYIHDTAMDSWYRFVKDGRIRSDLVGSLSLSSTDVAIYHHEQHMARVEDQIWVDYGTVSPAKIGANDGVPIVWVYLRP